MPPSVLAHEMAIAADRERLEAQVAELEAGWRHLRNTLSEVLRVAAAGVQPPVND